MLQTGKIYRPRYAEIWNVSSVLTYLKTLSPSENLDRKLLTKKQVMILALMSAQRVQSLSYLDIEHRSLLKDKPVFYIENCLKQSRPGFHVQPLVFEKYPSDENLCSFTLLNLYLKKSASLRSSSTALLISVQKPHKQDPIHSISRWINCPFSRRYILYRYKPVWKPQH